MATAEETTQPPPPSVPLAVNTVGSGLSPAEMLNFCDYYSNDIVKTKCKNFKNAWKSKIKSGQIFDDINNLFSVSGKIDDLSTDIDDTSSQSKDTSKPILFAILVAVGLSFLLSIIGLIIGRTRKQH